MQRQRFIPVLVFLACVGVAQPRANAAVRGWQGTIALPTYVLGPEDPNPPFRLISHSDIFPYTMLDDLTDRREVKTYRAIFLENEYLKAIILPDLGGRLYSLYDKVAKREVFYRNHVVKYGLIGLRGAWISGGMEFNFPNGHTVVTVSPVASRLIGGRESQSVLVGGADRVTGMYWQVELTLRSGEARLEQKVTLFNNTPEPQLYWYWANAAVPATEDMQFIYPMREVNPHSFTEIRTYPVWKGVDYSWYKNFRQPTSLFAQQVHRDFFGVYYHHSDFGVVHVADYREVPGKKIWSWGVAGDGLIWTKLLTDHDGPYNEIQSGRYETQLTQEFMPPQRVESWTEYWYPVAGLGGGFVEATRDLAVNVRFVPGGGAAQRPHVDLALAPTVDLPNAKVWISLAGQTLRESDIILRTSATATISVPVDDLEAARRTLAVDVLAGDGQKLLHWSAADPIDGNPDFVSAAGDHARAEKPASKMTVEELFLRGMEEEKRGGVEDSAATYRKVLDRDPGYIPAVLKLAWRDYDAADLPAAEALVARALVRNPADPQVQYVAGVIDRGAGRLALAEDAFWASIHFGGPSGRAYAELGEIAIAEKKYNAAARLLRQALAHDPDDALVLTDLAAALRLGGDRRQAGAAADQALEKMPLLPVALAERWRIAAGPASSASAVVQTEAENWDEPLVHQANTYLAVAGWYRSLGDLASSDAVLSRAVADLATPSPMIFYYQVADRLQEEPRGSADEAAAKGRAAPLTGVFPQTLADAQVLSAVVAHDPAAGPPNFLTPLPLVAAAARLRRPATEARSARGLSKLPRDAHALYLLGTFLFAHDRYEEAARLWLEARNDGYDDAVLERDLGVYEWLVKQNPKAAAADYAKAIQLAPDDYRLYPELDKIYTELGDASGRVNLFASAPPSVLDHDTVRVREVLLRVEQRQFDEALAVLSHHRFKPWEGGDIARQMFVLANVAQGRQALEKQNFTAAERDFRAALEYPVNLSVGKPDKPHDQEALFWLAETLAGEGRADAAQAAWRRAAGETSGGPQDAVFRAMALERLGESAQAHELLAAIILSASREDASADQLYAAGLAESLGGRKTQSQQDFRRALELNPLLWQARLELERQTDRR